MRHQLLGIVTAIVAFVAACDSAGTSEPLMDEIRAVRANNAADKIIIDALVEKYLPIDIDKNAALALCRDNGLKIYPITERRHFSSRFEEEVVCTRRGGPWNLRWRLMPFASDEVRVILSFNADQLKQRRGFIFLHTL